MEKTIKISKEDVFEKICKAAHSNTLGLFIGSGFVKSILSNNRSHKAYDWKELLTKTSEEMKIKKDLFDSGLPYPQIASEICFEYSKENKVKIKDAERRLKIIISDLVNAKLSNSALEEYEGHFKQLSPNWVVTTNYDLIIEQILHEKAFLINPQDSFIKTKDFTPVYHIHGSITDPESIVITNEDYTQTLRMSDYRHARLPFLIKESTVLMIGYSMNDLNVLSAVDYCQNVYTNVSKLYETPIIQLLYKSNAKTEPYVDENSDIIIQEISNLSAYLSELSEYVKRYKSIIGKKANEVKRLIEKFTASDSDDVMEFVLKEDARKELISTIKNIDYEFWYIYPSYIAFLNKGFSKLWDEASVQNAFSYYRDILEVLLDIIENIDYENTPYNFVEYLVEKFIEVVPYIGNSLGQSYAAMGLWKERAKQMPQSFVDELSKHQNGFLNDIRVRSLLKIRDDEEEI